MESLDQRPRILSISEADKQAKVKECLQSVVFSESQLKQMISTFESQIKLANSPDPNQRKQTDLFWENTYVRHLLDGTENGTFLGMDLGGTNFRIVRMDFNDGDASTDTKYYNLDKNLLTGQSSAIFDYIAVCLRSFLLEEKFKNTDRLSLGFTFSFPTFQKSLKESIMQTWTKSIKCVDGPGLDPCSLLEEAIQRQGGLPVPVEVIGRISDTTGTLLAGNLVDRQCRIGLILGTGSNAAFVEYTKNIEKWDESCEDADVSDIVLINCEFGCFGDNGCLDFMKTEFDHELDDHSNHPKSYTFEKLYAGHYLGELVRLVLVKLTKNGVLFSGQGSEKLFQRWNMSTSQITAIESDAGGDTRRTKEVFQELDLTDVSTDYDMALVQEVSELVSKRGAYIVATAMVVLLNHINLPEVTIGIDGSLYEHHPKYHNHMMDVLNKYASKTKSTIKLVKDGSGQGGAIVAAIAESKRLKQATK